MLPDIGSSDVLSVLKSGFSGISEEQTGEVVTQVASAATATTSPVAGALLPIIAAGLSQDKAVEIGAHADKKLEKKIDNLDKEDRKQAILIHALKGISTFLPDGNQWREATIQSANGDPEELIEILEEFQADSETRREYEDAAEKILTGDISDEIGEEENFVDFLRDRFDVDTRDQALSMFLDIRDVMKSREVHETLENTYNIESNIKEVRKEINNSEQKIKAKIDTVLEAGLEDEGFVRLNPLYFRGNKTESPETCWRIGFELEDVQAGHAANRLLSDGTTVSEHLVERLGEKQDLVLKGPPGVGKSTVCKQVALKWFENQRGTVFYRQNNRKRLTRQGVLSERIRDAEGHVLVVVEDAIRDESREILSTIKRFQSDDSVSFLLDSREQEWHESDQKISDSKLLEIKNNKIDSFTVPKLDIDECEAIVDHFETITGKHVEDNPASLLNEVQTETGAGEILHLSYQLSFYSSDPLTSEDANQITTFEKKIENMIEKFSSQNNSELTIRVSVLINILNGTELEVRPEYLHSFAEKKQEHEIIGNILDNVSGKLIFKQSETPAHEAVKPFRTNHEFWSILYLKKTIDIFGKREASRIFGDSVSALLSLVEDQQKHESINYYFQQDMQRLSDIAENSNKWADKFIGSIFELGRRRPMLAPLYGRTKYSQIDLPSSCSPKIRAQSAMWRGIMYYNGANIELAREELDHARELIDENTDIHSTTGQYIRARCLCYIGAGNLRFRGREFNTAEKHLLQSKKIFENIENELEKGYITGIGFVLVNLGRFSRRSGDFDNARNYLNKAIKMFENNELVRWKIIAMNHLGLVERDFGHLSTARDILEDAIKSSQNIADIKYQARCLNSLGDVEYTATRLDKAERHWKQGLKLMQKVGDKQGKTYIYHNLGKIYLTRDDLGAAEDHFQKGLKLEKDIGKTRGEGVSYTYLGRTMRAQNEFDEAERYLDKAHELVQDVGGGTNRRVAESLYVRGLVARDQGKLDSAKRLFNDALEISIDIGDQKTEAEIRCELGNLALKQGEINSAEQLLQDALSIEESVDNLVNIAHLHGNFGILEVERENWNGAKYHLQRSRNVMEEIKSSRGVAYADLYLGRILHRQEEHNLAASKMRKALDTFEKTGDERRCIKCHISLGKTAHRQGKNQDSNQILNEAINRAQNVGDMYHLAMAETAYGDVLSDGNNQEQSVNQVIDASDRFLEIGAPIRAREVLSKLLNNESYNINDDIATSVRNRLQNIENSTR